ncbi:hypothetical protein BGP_5970 [Beggiatoa sp. PS]|nr:hypothetical protein BGP_5970 [Beggiatoa sp. PS]
MKLADIVDNVVINSRKLTHYALDPNSLKGKHKAVLFENYWVLLRKIILICFTNLKRSLYQPKQLLTTRINMENATRWTY